MDLFWAWPHEWIVYAYFGPKMDIVCMGRTRGKSSSRWTRQTMDGSMARAAPKQAWTTCTKGTREWDIRWIRWTYSSFSWSFSWSLDPMRRDIRERISRPFQTWMQQSIYIEKATYGLNRRGRRTPKWRTIKHEQRRGKWMCHVANRMEFAWSQGAFDDDMIGQHWLHRRVTRMKIRCRESTTSWRTYDFICLVWHDQKRPESIDIIYIDDLWKIPSYLSRAWTFFMLFKNRYIYISRGVSMIFICVFEYSNHHRHLHRDHVIFLDRTNSSF